MSGCSRQYLAEAVLTLNNTRTRRNDISRLAEEYLKTWNGFRKS